MYFILIVELSENGVEKEYLDYLDLQVRGNFLRKGNGGAEGLFGFVL